MEQERHEVYERIPWETLEKQGGDRQWVWMAVAGAVALGALAFTFMRSQPTALPATIPSNPIVSSPAAPPGPESSVQIPPAQPAVTAPPAPMALAEADLFAVDPVMLRDVAAAHAEWFAVEFFSYDGSDQSSATLLAILPEGVPAPEAPEGIQVFVDWVGVTQITETAPAAYEVGLIVRSLVAHGESPFARQAPRAVNVDVAIGPDGAPVVTRPPSMGSLTVSSSPAMGLTEVPENVRLQVEANHGQVIGGEPTADGRWKVVVLVEGTDGVRRPMTVLAP